MSASAWMDRSRRSRTTPALEDNAAKREWIGVDFARRGNTRPSGALLPLLVLALLAGLGVASLRIDLIRTRYALASTMAQEQGLIEDQRALIVRKRQLRDPVELARLARERGFRPADTVRSVPDPMPPAMTTSLDLEAATRPAVAAGPPSETADPHAGTGNR